MADAPIYLYLGGAKRIAGLPIGGDLELDFLKDRPSVRRRDADGHRVRTAWEFLASIARWVVEGDLGMGDPVFDPEEVAPPWHLRRNAYSDIGTVSPPQGAVLNQTKVRKTVPRFPKIINLGYDDLD